MTALDDWRSALAERLRGDLDRHVVKPWFPRSVDRQAGGFLCDFDSRWQPSGEQLRLLEFQARQTRSAARLGLAGHDGADWHSIVRHGIDYLRGPMHDSQHGGWYGLIDRAGNPLAGSTKHGHGTAYLISAGVEGYRLTGAEEALELARDAFEWLEAVLHDEANGGYHGWATRDGRPILEPGDVPPDYGASRDPLGHGIGLKDANVHSDLLDALALLHAVWRDARVRERLIEVYRLVTTRLVTPDGAMHYMTHSDFTPVPGPERHGTTLQSGPRIWGAAALVDGNAGAAQRQARSMLDHALAVAWDGRLGGFFDAGPAAEPMILGGVDLRARRRPWWVQTEGARLLLLMALAYPEAQYGEQLDRQIDLIDRDLLDHRRGGWHALPRGERSWRARVWPRAMPKADIWKDASHEADLYLFGLRLLEQALPDPGAALGYAPSAP